MKPRKVTKSIVVNTNVSHAYQLWSDIENFPNFMRNIKSIKKTGERTSHWVKEGPLGKEIEWDARTTAMEPDRRIAWEGMGGHITTSGEVTFKPLPDDRTEVTLSMSYTPEGGIIAEALARILDNPERNVEQDLHDFKSYAESLAPVGAHERG